jgi:RNA polymerase sigma factor (sigma-70 family)
VDEIDARRWDEIYKAARLSSSRTQRTGRGIVPSSDAFQNSVVWALEHWHKIVEWDEEGSLPFKLRKTFNNEGQKAVAKERQAQSRGDLSDNFYYTPEILHELLRDVWDYSNWTSTPDLNVEFVTTTKKPDEGNNRVTMFSDLKAAYDSLNEADQMLLRQRYESGGLEFEELADLYQISEHAIRKRVSRALLKLQDKLGGDAPIWNRRRRVRTNAQARAEMEEK